MFTQLQEYPPALVLVVGAGCLYLFTRLVQLGITYRRHALIIRKHGCKPYPRYPHKDYIFGFDTFRENLRLNSVGGLLEVVRGRYTMLKTKTFSQLMLGEKIIMTCEPENVKAILATQFKEFDLPVLRMKGIGDIFGHGIFTNNGKAWEESRALLRPNFTRSQVGDIETFEAHVSKLIAKIPRDGSVVDMQELFFMLTLDSATDFLFGYSTNVLDEMDPESPGVKFGEAFQYVTEKAGIRGRAGWLGFFIPDKRYEQEKKFVHQYIGKYVQSAVELHQKSLNQEKAYSEEKESGKYVFLEHLAKTDYSKTKIQAELLNILLAGRDTTASMLSYFFYYLARRPDVWNKLRAEILEFGPGTPTFEQIKSLKYLQWCLNETLRLHPIVPLNGRVANTDTTLPLGGGKDGKSPILVPKGQVVGYQVYVMQRRHDLYGEDADEFKPERWNDLRPGWQFLPFNGGPRICIGQQFALIEASYAIVRILQTFKSIEKKDNSTLTEYLTLTAAVRGGVKVGFTPA